MFHPLDFVMLAGTSVLLFIGFLLIDKEFKKLHLKVNECQIKLEENKKTCVARYVILEAHLNDLLNTLSTIADNIEEQGEQRDCGQNTICIKTPEGPKEVTYKPQEIVLPPQSIYIVREADNTKAPITRPATSESQDSQKDNNNVN